MENYHQNTRASLWIKAILCCSPKQEEIEEGAEANFSCCSSACYSWHRVTAELSGNRNFWTCQDANRDLMAYVYSSKDGKLYLPTSYIHMYFKYVGEFVNNTQHPVWKALKCLFFLSWQQRHPIPFTSSLTFRSSFLYSSRLRVFKGSLSTCPTTEWVGTCVLMNPI